MTLGADKLRVQIQVSADVAAFYRLGLALMQLYAIVPFPCHDPPVAWLSGVGFNWATATCPALLLDGEVRADQLPDDVPVLASEPGRRP